MTKRQFYRTTVEVEILSERPLDGSYSLDEINYMITEGDCSGRMEVTRRDIIDGRTCASMLINQGSDPGFFSIDEEGNESEEDGTSD